MFVGCQPTFKRCRDELPPWRAVQQMKWTTIGPQLDASKYPMLTIGGGGIPTKQGTLSRQTEQIRNFSKR